MKRIAVLCSIILAFSIAGCSDPYGACEQGALTVANSISTGMQSVDAFRQAGKITPQEEGNILGYLKFANDTNGAFAVCAQQAHNAGSKSGAYTACAQTFVTALNNPQELALIHVSNPNSQQEVQLIVTGIATGVNGILVALGGH
jgi:hypothetical protein